MKSHHDVCSSGASDNRTSQGLPKKFFQSVQIEFPENVEITSTKMAVSESMNSMADVQQRPRAKTQKVVFDHDSNLVTFPSQREAVLVEEEEINESDQRIKEKSKSEQNSNDKAGTNRELTRSNSVSEVPDEESVSVIESLVSRASFIAEETTPSDDEYEFERNLPQTSQKSGFTTEEYNQDRNFDVNEYSSNAPKFQNQSQSSRSFHHSEAHSSSSGNEHERSLPQTSKKSGFTTEESSQSTICDANEYSSNFQKSQSQSQSARSFEISFHHSEAHSSSSGNKHEKDLLKTSKKSGFTTEDSSQSTICDANEYSSNSNSSHHSFPSLSLDQYLTNSQQINLKNPSKDTSSNFHIPTAYVEIESDSNDQKEDFVPKLSSQGEDSENSFGEKRITESPKKLISLQKESSSDFSSERIEDSFKHDSDFQTKNTKHFESNSSKSSSEDPNVLFEASAPFQSERFQSETTN